MPWSTSDRRTRLPKDWHRRRAIAKRNANGQCQWQTDGIRCTTPGTDCDHIDRNGSDEPANLQWLCRRHHTIKTQAESHASRPRQARPKPRHPGLL
jgi:5-methylcytosine-specific restriction protein A